MVSPALPCPVEVSQGAASPGVSAAPRAPSCRVPPCPRARHSCQPHRHFTGLGGHLHTEVLQQGDPKSGTLVVECHQSEGNGQEGGWLLIVLAHFRRLWEAARSCGGFSETFQTIKSLQCYKMPGWLEWVSGWLRASETSGLQSAVSGLAEVTPGTLPGVRAPHKAHSSGAPARPQSSTLALQGFADDDLCLMEMPFPSSPV